MKPRRCMPASGRNESPDFRNGSQRNGAAGYIAAPSLFHLEVVRRSELHRHTGVERALGAGTAWTGDAAYGGRAGNGGSVVIEAELVLPVAIGNPDVHIVGPFRTPDRLGGVEGQADRLRIELNLGSEDIVRDTCAGNGSVSVPFLPYQAARPLIEKN